MGCSTAELREALVGLDAVDLVIDVSPASGPSQLSAFQEGFLHVVPHGAWVALRSSGPLRRGEPLVDVARQLQGPDARHELGQPWREHVRSAADVHVTSHLVAIDKAKTYVFLLREDGAPAVLRTREPDLEVTEIARLEAGALDTEGRMHEYGVEPYVRVPEVLNYPTHTLRRYDGPVHLPRGPLAYHGRTVLPDSFRWHLGSHLKANGLQISSRDFARVRDPLPAQRLDGSYYHFLYAHPGHFGHLMTEPLSRLWGWSAAKEADPSLKMLCRRHLRKGEPGLETVLLPAYGVDPDDIVWIDKDVTVESMVGCTPMWHNSRPFYAHPGMREVWARLRDGLVGSDEPSTEEVGTAEQIFVTRRRFNRPCSNVMEVEKFFVDRGFTVVQPEQLSIPDQARTFAAARVIAGFGGASMFNLAYAESPKAVILLSQSAYHARNEHLYAAVHGAELHSFWSKPLHDHPPGEMSYRAHQSPWTFDFELHTEQLDAVVRRLVQ